MARYTVDEFFGVTESRDPGEDVFEIENDRFLKVNLDGQVWTKMGSMVAHEGKIKFSRERIFEHGLGKLLKRTASAADTRLIKTNGRGRLYLADKGKKIYVLSLDGEVIYVNGNDLLAFQKGIRWDIKLMRRIAGMQAGGLFSVKLSGSGLIAITTHYDPLSLRVTPQAPVTTDPNATVAWSGTLSPKFRTDISFKTFLGRGSGKSIQMVFQGDGSVIIQPQQEVYFQAAGLKRR
jgi:uncharacterized protein (AIM24 family)